MTGHDPGDPGAWADPSDPDTSRVLYALQLLRVTGQAAAADVLDAAGGAGLTTEQQAAVLDGIAQPDQLANSEHDSADDPTS